MSQKNSPTNGSSAPTAPDNFNIDDALYDFSHNPLLEPARIKCSSCGNPQWHTGIEVNVFKLDEVSVLPVKTKRILVCTHCGNIVSK